MGWGGEEGEGRTLTSHSCVRVLSEEDVAAIDKAR